MSIVLGIAGVFVSLFAGVVFLALMAWLVITVAKKSKERGVVIKDGISSEELGIVVNVINEQLATKKVSDVLAKVATAITEAQTARNKP